MEPLGVLFPHLYVSVSCACGCTCIDFYSPVGGFAVWTRSAQPLTPGPGHLLLPLFLQIVFCSRSQASQPCLLLQRHEFVRTVAAQRLAPLETSGSSV